MQNAEEVLQTLERFTKLKQKEIPHELEDYLCFVAKTGDTIFRWAIIKALFREKLITVIKQFYEQTAIDDLPHYPNVDPFNYDTMKTALLERLDSFGAAPFTIQRISELLTDPRKQYSRIDKFMRAIEKNILVVSTTEPGRPKSVADSSDYSDSLDSMVNGSSNVTGVGSGLGDDLGADIDVDIELESGVGGATATIAVAVPGATLPSINTLNSAILAASNGASTSPAEDLLHHHHHEHDLGDEEVTDEDDDEDVVHNHLPTDGLPAVEAVLGEADEVAKAPGKKRLEEDGEEGEESAKKAKLEEEEVKDVPVAEPESTPGDSVPAIVEESVAAKTDEAETIIQTTTCEKPTGAGGEEVEEEAKDLTDEVAAATTTTSKNEEQVEGPKEQAVEKKEEKPETAPLSEDSPVEEQAAKQVEEEESIVATIENAKVVEEESAALSSPAPSAVVESIIVADINTTAIPEKAATGSPEVEEEEAMDVKPIDAVDPMEAETLVEAPPTVQVLAGSEMDVDPSSSDALDEPMEDQ